MAKSRAIANLAVVISARTKKFEKGFDRASRRLKRFGKSILSATAGIRRFGMMLLGAVGIGSIAAFTASIYKSVQSLDALAKSSDRLKIAPERLAGLRHAAQLAGMDIEKLDQSLVYLRRRVSEAASGMGESIRAFEMMGLNAKEIIKLPLDQQLAVVADGMKRLGNQSDRVRVSMDIFGRSGVGMLNLLAGGSKAFDEATAKVKQYGLAFSRFDLAKVEAFNDAMTDMGAALNGLRHAFTGKIATYMTIITETLTEMVVDARDFGNVMVEGLVKAAGAAGKVLDVMRSIRKMHLEGQIAALKIKLPLDVGKGWLTNLGRLVRLQLGGLGIQLPGRADTHTPAMADAMGTAQAIRELESKIAELNKLPAATDEWIATVNKLISELRINVRRHEYNLMAKLLGARFADWVGGFLFNTQQALPESTAAKFGRAAWTQVSQTRSAFPSGVAAVSKTKPQAVTDEPVRKVLEKMVDWLMNNPKQASALWAVVK